MFNVGDKVRVVSPESFYYRCIGTILDVGVSISSVDFGSHVNLFLNENIERVDGMDINERLSEVIKENQKLKQQLSEQNIKLNKIQADLKRELNGKGVSDEDFRNAIKHFSNIDEDERYEIWESTNYFYLFAHTPLSEFVNKYKKYKDKHDNEIKVGDEVIVKPKGYSAMVTAFATQLEELTIFTKEHNTFEVFVSDVEKTGRHFDNIDEFMKS